jgi:DNA invertase Pin-like site-specific DNA recombinase
MASQILHEEKSRLVRAALYARVSTSNNGQDPSMQTRELREYCERRGWKVSGEFVDEGISGTKDSRPELNRLMADAHRRRFDAVVVWRFDRFARSVSHLLRALENFKALGIEFVSISEQVDTSTPTGKMVFTVLGAVAELERSLIAERVKAGLRNARAKGKRLGRPRVVVDAARITERRERIVRLLALLGRPPKPLTMFIALFKKPSLMLYMTKFSRTSAPFIAPSMALTRRNSPLS